MNESKDTYIELTYIIHCLKYHEKVEISEDGDGLGMIEMQFWNDDKKTEFVRISVALATDLAHILGVTVKEILRLKEINNVSNT